MIRPFTFLTMLLAAGSGLYLYQAKQQGRLIDQRIADLDTATATMRQRAEVLRAEYTLLNDPSRLADLVAAHLPDLKPTLPGQWTSMAELDNRLPPVGASTSAPAPLEPGEPDAREPQATVAAPVAPPAHVAVPMAEAAPGPREPVRVALHEPAHRAPQVARSATPRPIIAATREEHAHRPERIAAAPLPAPARAGGAYHPPAPAYPVLATRRAAPVARPTAPVVASALGMAQTMFAPVEQADAASLPVDGAAR